MDFGLEHAVLSLRFFPRNKKKSSWKPRFLEVKLTSRTAGGQQNPRGSITSARTAKPTIMLEELRAAPRTPRRSPAAPGPRHHVERKGREQGSDKQGSRASAERGGRGQRPAAEPSQRQLEGGRRCAMCAAPRQPKSAALAGSAEAPRPNTRGAMRGGNGGSALSDLCPDKPRTSATAAG